MVWLVRKLPSQPLHLLPIVLVSRRTVKAPENPADASKTWNDDKNK